MIYYFTLKQYEERKSIYALYDITGRRFDVSKRFIKKDKETGRLYFEKTHKMYHTLVTHTIKTLTFLTPDETYVVFLTRLYEVCPVITDLMNVKELDEYRGLNKYAKESYRR